MSKKNILQLCMVWILIITIFSGCTGTKTENDSTSVENVPSGDRDTTLSVYSQIAEDSTSSNVVSSNITSAIQSNTSATTSSTPKIYKPKTKKEGVALSKIGYDLIERPEPEELTGDISKEQLNKYAEELFEIKLPQNTKFEPKGTIDFNYKVTNKYYFNYTSLGVYFTNLFAYYNEEEVNFIKNQIIDHKDGWIDFTADNKRFFNLFGDEIKNILGDYPNGEYSIFVKHEIPMVVNSNGAMSRYIFIIKDETANKYVVIFNGHANNYELRNGKISIQNEGAGRVIPK